MTEQTNRADSWHVSKAVPVTLILALIIQAAVVVWQGSQWTSAINANASDIAALRVAQNIQQSNSQSQAVQLARIEENTRNLVARMEELVRQLERRVQP